MGYLTGANGEKSSKRLMGVIYMLMALIMAIVDQLTKFNITSFEVWITVVVTGASLLGISLLEYFSKTGIIKPKPTPPNV